MDPYEKGLEEGGGAVDFLARNMWLLVPIQQKIKAFFKDFEKYPYQAGSTLNPSGIGYGLAEATGCIEAIAGNRNDVGSKIIGRTCPKGYTIFFAWLFV